MSNKAKEFKFEDYENIEPEKQNEFDFSKYENISPKVSNKDIEEAKKQLKGKYPDWLINNLMPLVVKMEESKNQPRGIFSKILNPVEGDYPGSGAIGAHIRSLRRAPLTASENIVDFIPSLFGKSVVNREAKFPPGFAPEKEDIQHPMAQITGEIQGLGPLGGGLISGARAAIPAISKFAESGLIPGLTTSAAEGGALGGLMSNKGERGSGALFGAALGVGGNILHDLIKSIPGGIEWLTKYGNTKQYKTKLNKINQEIEKAKTEHAPQEEIDNLERLKQEHEYDQYKKELEKHPLMGTSKPETLYRYANQRAEKVKQIESQQESIPEEFRAETNPEEPNIKEIDELEHQKPNLIDIENIPKHPVDEEIVPKAQSLLKTSEQKHAEHEKSFVEEKLHQGKHHTRRAGEKLNQKIEQKQKEIGNEYQQLESKLDNEHVTIKRAPETRKIMSDMIDRLEHNPEERAEVIKLNDELNTSGDEVSIPAGRFVSAYRSLRQMAKKTRADAYGETPVEHDRLIARANEMDADVKRMENIINDSLPEERLKDLHKINTRYATEFAPLYESDFYKHLLKHTKAPKNMIEALTSEVYKKSSNPNKITGTKILKDFIKEDPELLELVIGERFHKKPSDIHKFDETVKEYLDVMPKDFKESMELHKTNIENIDKAHEQLENAKEQYEQLKKEAAEKDREAIKLAKEFNEQEKMKAEKIKKNKIKQTKKENKQEKNRYKNEKQYYENKIKLEKLNQEIELLEKTAKEAEQKSIAALKSKEPGKSAKYIMNLEKEARSAKADLLRAQKERVILLKKIGGLSLLGTSIYIGKRNL